MPFYLKAKYQNKIKKYIVNDVKQIDILQIKSNFTPKIPVNLPLIFFITNQLNCSFTTKSEHELLQYLSTHRFEDKSTVKIEIKKEECDEQNQGPFYSDKEYNKIRSKSEQIQSNLMTYQFDISVEEKHLRHSMFESQSSLQQIQQFVARKQNQLAQLRSDKRFVNIKSVVDFMKNQN